MKTEPILNANSSQTISLRLLRRKNDKSLSEVAKALGVVERTAYYYETGQRRLSFEQVLILAKLYNVNAEEIIKSQINC